MLFTVIFAIFTVFFTKINGCTPKQNRSCTTVNGTQGICIQSKECPDIHRLNRLILSSDEHKFVTASVCGRDIDKAQLYCCDINRIKLSGNQNGSNQVDFRQSEQSGASSNGFLSELVAATQVPTTIFSTTAASTTTASSTTTAAKPVSEISPTFCQTPNGQRAQCISIYECTTLRNIVGNVTESQRRFLLESTCVLEYNNPWVCCGSDTDFQKNEASIQTTRQNALLPVGSCGFQGTNVEEAIIPVISTRRGNRRAMNFTLPNRIFGGTSTDIGEFPWTALLEYETSDGRKTFACGGSLISSRYVLTAAHCVSHQSLDANKLIGVRLGEWDYAKVGADCVTVNRGTICNDAELNVRVESIHSFPSYEMTSQNKYHDIALIRLDRDVTFTRFIRPICLPSGNNPAPPGERLTISGWGLVGYDRETTILQKVEVPAISRSQCSIMFERAARVIQLGAGQMCAGGEAGKDACVGDSGGPLMRNVKSNASDPGLWFIEGIVSFGTGCGFVNRYGVYTKVSEYLGWIHNTIAP